MRRAFFGALTLLLAGVLTSCSEAPGTHGLEAVGKLTAPVKAVPDSSVLHGVLLQGGDVHQGWQLVQPDLPIAPGAAGCLEHHVALPAPAGAATIEYRDPQDPLPVLVEALASYPPAQAQGAYQSLVGALQSCSAATIRVGFETLHADVARAGPVDLHVTNQEFAATLSGPAGDLHAGVAVFVDGTVIGGVVYTTPGGSPAIELKEYAQRAVDKLALLG